MRYFAYGSNMSDKRLQKRVTSANVIGVYTLFSHKLRFHKVGLDGSAKCDAMYTGIADDVVYGVLFDISPNEKIDLDRAEGLGAGYREKEVEVVDNFGKKERAFLYIASKVDASLKCFIWYKMHVLVGATAGKFPVSYIKYILDVPAVDDHDSVRQAKELSIYSKSTLSHHQAILNDRNPGKDK